MIEKKEIFGDDLNQLLDSVELKKPGDRLDEGGDVAADVTSIANEVAPAVPERPPRTPRLQLGPHRQRFLVIYGMLAVVLGVAVAGVVVFAGKSINPAPKWSAWKPHGGGLGAAKEIADQVAKSYRLPGGGQLVDVIARAPSVSASSTQTIPIHYLAVHGTKGRRDEIFTVSSSDSVMYSLCGLGASCSIATGKASPQRGRLVRREILELALYTFKYAGGIKNVIAFMPPAAGRQPKYVVYLQKTDLAAELHKPLVQTLAAKTPLATTISADDVHAVDAVTIPRVYNVVRLSQTQQGDAVLELTAAAGEVVARPATIRR